ncbi:MAG: hypothetical protein J6S67_25440 [Methanobrevibacter sp.]|nr:hypothetical protein [Methanobrevibacter sp.]
MNTARKYIVTFMDNHYECKNKPELNMLLGKISSGIGRIYANKVSITIEVIK